MLTTSLEHPQMGNRHLLISDYRILGLCGPLLSVPWHVAFSQWKLQLLGSTWTIIAEMKHLMASCNNTTCGTWSQLLQRYYSLTHVLVIAKSQDCAPRRVAIRAPPCSQIYKCQLCRPWRTFPFFSRVRYPSPLALPLPQILCYNFALIFCKSYYNSLKTCQLCF